MIEKFNGIFYLIVFIIHFIGFGAYAYQMIIGNQKFRAKFEIDETAATIMRMAGAIFLGSFSPKKIPIPALAYFFPLLLHAPSVKTRTFGLN